MSMLYLNVQHTLPMIGMRSQKNTLEAGINQPSYDQTSQQARSNKGKTQPKIDIDSYPSRHSYGYTNHTDFARENEQEGLSGVQQGTSKHTQMAWALAEDGPKPGRMVPIEQVQSEVQSIADQNRVLVAAAIPKPEISFDIGEVVGETEVGAVSTQWQIEPRARIEYNRGSIETYLERKGDIHGWVSEGHYDILA